MVQKKEWDSRISEKLFDGAKNLSQLSLILKCNRNTLSNELRKLVNNGHLIRIKQKNETLYALNTKTKNDPSQMMDNLEYLLKREDDTVIKLKKLPYIFKKKITHYEIRKGQMSLPENPSLVEKAYLSEVMTFKVNPKADKILKEVVRVVNFYLEQASYYSLMEAFDRTGSGLTKRDSRKMRDLSIANAKKLINDLIKLEPDAEGCLHDFMITHSTIYAQLGSFILPPRREVFLPKNETSPQTIKKLSKKMIEKIKKEKKD